MQYRKMGSLDWEVSALGFGCMRLPSRKLNRLRADAEESIRIIRHGIDLGINSLSSEEEDVITRLADVYRSKILVPCTACGYCMPCPAGVNIPKNFAILNNVSMESNRFMRWQVRRGYRKLSSSTEERGKETLNGNASLCVSCGQYLEKCPQRISIPDELKKVHAILGKRERISDHYS